MRFAAAFITLFFMSFAARAQEVPEMRWGEVSEAEAALDRYDPDPDAGALVLGDVGRAVVRVVRDRRFEFEMKRHRRVKVFQESGYELGEVSLYYSADADIRGLRGQTLVPEPDGTYRRVELDRGSVIREEVRDGVMEARFSMPALAPGALFEYEYTYASERIFSPPTWVFQSAEPTLYSHYEFASPAPFRYVTLSQGAHVRMHPQEVEEASRWQRGVLRWTAEDVPALREEPYTTAEADYLQKVDLQLSTIEFENRAVERVLGTWKDAAEELESHGEFGRRLRRNRSVSDLAAAASGETEAERAQALYDLVRAGWVWNGEPGIFADRDLDDVVETRSGSAGELSLLLLALLREADIQASPMLISTRGNGRVVRRYPLISQFDRMLVLVEPEGADAKLLDPTDRLLPYGVPSVAALSGTGWIADPSGPVWIDYVAPATSSSQVMVQGAVDAEGQMAGAFALRVDGYPALNLRTELAQEASGAPAEAASEAADTAAEVGLELSEVDVTGADDPYVPVSVRAVLAAQPGERVGDEIYLTPFVAMRMDENPFKRPERSFPVDFAFPFSRTYLASIQLPPGYVPESLPEPVQMTIPSQAVSYTRQIGVSGGMLQVRAALDVSASAVGPEEYGALRDLYDEIVGAESEVVVLVPAPEAASPEAEGR